jgi:hypothetical protein
MAVAAGARNEGERDLRLRHQRCTRDGQECQPDEPNRRQSLVWSYGGVPYSLWGSLKPFKFPLTT